MDAKVESRELVPDQSSSSAPLFNFSKLMGEGAKNARDRETSKKKPNGKDGDAKAEKEEPEWKGLKN